MIKIISKIISIFCRHKRDKTTEDKLQQQEDVEQINKRISSINRELLNFKIDIEREIELYVVNKYNQELRSKNLIN